METRTALNCTKGIILPTNTRADESESNSSAPEKKLSSAQKRQMRCLCGGDSLMIQESAESIALYSEMNHSTKARHSSDRRIKLLIASGLVAGITPTSRRKRLPQQTLDFAFLPPDGEGSNGKQEVD